MPAENEIKPVFSWNDIGNRFLWLGYLLSKLDATYKDDTLLLTPNEENRKIEIGEIMEWQDGLLRALASNNRQARILNKYIRAHKVDHFDDAMKYRLIAVVLYRQTLNYFRDTWGIHIARMGSLERTLESVLRHRNMVAGLVRAGVFVPETYGDKNYLGLHRGLGNFLLGDNMTPAEKPVASQPESPPHEQDAPATEKPATDEAEKPAPDTPAKTEKPKVISLPDFIKSLPIMSPMEMAELIHAEGFIGQDRAVQSVCLLAWRHINRLRQVFVEGIAFTDIPPKNNALLMGPTGCGKTFLIELLFSSIIKLPVVIFDASALTESGYVGGDVSNIFTRLIQVAGDDIEKATTGIVCLDEFDKLAGTGSAVSFNGENTNKDLKLGVQHELLKLLEASEVPVPLEMRKGSTVKKVMLNTRHVPFLCCGAFSGFWRVLNKRHVIGFGPGDKTDTKSLKDEMKTAFSFERYGIIPELFGRLHSITVFDALSRDELKAILERNTIRQYEKELALNGIGLQVHPDVYSFIVEQCLERQTGARGLQTALTSHLEDALFVAYSDTTSQSIRLFVDGQEIGWQVQKRRVKAPVKVSDDREEISVEQHGTALVTG